VLSHGYRTIFANPNAKVCFTAVFIEGCCVLGLFPYVAASELSVEARATALSLHSFFFFMGQTIGPIAYGAGIPNVGKKPSLLVSAVVIIALGILCARFLRQTRPADAA
jgi:hypothetical protein